MKNNFEKKFIIFFLRFVDTQGLLTIYQPSSAKIVRDGALCNQEGEYIKGVTYTFKFA